MPSTMAPQDDKQPRFSCSSENQVRWPNRDRYDKSYFSDGRMMKHSEEIPATIRNVAQLEDLLSMPTQAAVDAVRQVNGDFMILGAAGKMGPSLARMIRRAADGLQCRVIAVSRLSSRD